MRDSKVKSAIKPLITFDARVAQLFSPSRKGDQNQLFVQWESKWVHSQINGFSLKMIRFRIFRSFWP